MNEKNTLGQENNPLVVDPGKAYPFLKLLGDFSAGWMAGDEKRRQNAMDEMNMLVKEEQARGLRIANERAAQELQEYTQFAPLEYRKKAAQATFDIQEATLKSQKAKETHDVYQRALQRLREGVGTDEDVTLWKTIVGVYEAQQTRAKAEKDTAEAVSATAKAVGDKILADYITEVARDPERWNEAVKTHGKEALETFIGHTQTWLKKGELAVSERLAGVQERTEEQRRTEFVEERPIRQLQAETAKTTAEFYKEQNALARMKLLLEVIDSVTAKTISATTTQRLSGYKAFGDTLDEGRLDAKRPLPFPNEKEDYTDGDIVARQLSSFLQDAYLYSAVFPQFAPASVVDNRVNSTVQSIVGRAQIQFRGRRIPMLQTDGTVLIRSAGTTQELDVLDANGETRRITGYMKVPYRSYLDEVKTEARTASRVELGVGSAGAQGREELANWFIGQVVDPQDASELRTILRGMAQRSEKTEERVIDVTPSEEPVSPSSPQYQTPRVLPPPISGAPVWDPGQQLPAKRAAVLRGMPTPKDVVRVKQQWAYPAGADEELAVHLAAGEYEANNLLYTTLLARRTLAESKGYLGKYVTINGVKHNVVAGEEFQITLRSPAGTLHEVPRIGTKLEGRALSDAEIKTKQIVLQVQEDADTGRVLFYDTIPAVYRYLRGRYPAMDTNQLIDGVLDYVMSGAVSATQRYQLALAMNPGLRQDVLDWKTGVMRVVPAYAGQEFPLTEPTPTPRALERLSGTRAQVAEVIGLSSFSLDWGALLRLHNLPLGNPSPRTPVPETSPTERHDLSERFPLMKPIEESLERQKEPGTTPTKPISYAPAVGFDWDNDKPTYRRSWTNSLMLVAGQLVIPEASEIGFRNNNPGNLKHAGQPASVKGEKGFAKFKTVEDGFRALVAQIVLDGRRGKSLAQFVQTYAGNTDYLPTVEQLLDADAETLVKSLNPFHTAQAIMWVENNARFERRMEV